MRLKNTDLLVALAACMVNVLCILTPIAPPWLKFILALPLIFVLPGYILTEILFRKIARSHHLLLTLGLSLAIVIIVGLLLNALPSGLQSVSWVLSLSLISVTGILILMIRRGKVAGRALRIRVLHVYEYFLFMLALSGIIFALQYAREGMAGEPHPGFTQFWMLPTGDNSCGVSLGIHSFESGQVAYSVSITANDVLVSTQFPGVLQVGEQVQQTVNLPPGVQDGSVDVRARLYRSDKPGQVYRSVNIILHQHTGHCTW